MNVYLAVDFGSTFTKLTAIDVSEGKIIATAKSFTTIETDVREGFNKALDEIYKQCGKIEFSKKLASSSAAGGLKMISVGLVTDLTAKASRLAATSAGAKVLKTYSYEMSNKEQEEIYEINPDIVLLSGGIDGGNQEVIIHNAKKLGEIKRDFSIIVAGNKAAGDKVVSIIESFGKQALLCENVMPKFNKLNILPAKAAIRELFIKNIISAKGLDKAQELMSDEVIPTPLAVYDAAFILSKGSNNEIGLGDLMVYDVGGATTDVYSMASGYPTTANVYMEGIEEPFAKRTVEGDIGMRYSINSLLEEASVDIIAERAKTETSEVLAWVEKCKLDPSVLPEKGSAEQRIDKEFAASAVEISAVRHCGFTEKSFSPVGEVILQTGKDLTKTKYIIGTGGSVINSPEPVYPLSKGIYSPKDINVLKPLKPEILLDKKNIFAAMGLLSKFEPDTAIKIMKKEFINLKD